MSPIKVQATDSWGFAVGEITLRTHEKKDCTGRHCVIHNPSDHSLKDAPLNWRDDKGVMERICEHGVCHDDPDDVAYRRSLCAEDSDWIDWIGVHGCCGYGCCG